MADKPDHDAANAWRTASSTRPSMEEIFAESMHKNMHPQNRWGRPQTLEANKDLKPRLWSRGRQREPAGGAHVTQAAPRQLAS